MNSKEFHNMDYWIIGPLNRTHRLYRIAYAGEANFIRITKISKYFSKHKEFLIKKYRENREDQWHCVSEFININFSTVGKAALEILEALWPIGFIPLGLILISKLLKRKIVIMQEEEND